MVHRAGAPWLAALAAGLVALVLLGVQLAADPATGVTFSNSPFTDEGWSVVGARNQVLLGRWATDEWQLFWAQLPFNMVVAAVFEAFGVGIIQARAVSVACTVVASAVLAAFVSRRMGGAAGIVAGVGLATSTVVLFYGRLAFLEPMVLLFLTLGAVTLLSGGAEGSWRRGAIAGAALALAIGTKPSAGVAVVGMLLGALIAGRPAPPGLRRRITAAVAVIGVSGAVWLLVVLPQPGLLDAILRVWPQQSMPVSVAEAWDRVVGYVRNSDRAIPMTAPLIGGAVVGVALAAWRWARLEPRQRALVGSAVGWFALGMAILLVVSYRPSRYVVPLIPPLAILTGVGFALALAEVRTRIPRLSQRGIVVAMTVLFCAAIGLRGIGAVVEWTRTATYRLPQIQAELLTLVTDAHAIQGAGPTMAMRVPVPTIVGRSFVNAGDLYATHDVRWLLFNRQMTPTWASRHADAWAARELIVCYPWPSGEACLIRLP